uniref:Uncharacterized protein n=1 Tax=Marseillevirus LCMAC103 TaxID=2506604 RepID=A0A481YTT6_9VIRU|nr:MAG: hypothetical protein LCMAC103_00620 [Marseillevirus LCMAC103]
MWPEMVEVPCPTPAEDTCEICLKMFCGDDMYLVCAICHTSFSCFPCGFPHRKTLLKCARHVDDSVVLQCGEDVGCSCCARVRRAHTAWKDVATVAKKTKHAYRLACLAGDWARIIIDNPLPDVPHIFDWRTFFTYEDKPCLNYQDAPAPSALLAATLDDFGWSADKVPSGLSEEGRDTLLSFTAGVYTDDRHVWAQITWESWQRIFPALSEVVGKNPARMVCELVGIAEVEALLDWCACARPQGHSLEAQCLTARTLVDVRKAVYRARWEAATEWHKIRCDA